MARSDTSIYIVDSDPEVRQGLSSLLESDADKVVLYGSADDFLSDFDPDHPSCVILDLHGPGADGYALLENMRDRNIKVPVIALTRFGDVPAAVRAMRLGAADVLEKPVDPQILLSTARLVRAIDRDRERLSQQVAAAQRLLASLTQRECELFHLLIDGKSNKEAAVCLGISPRTVEHHRAHIKEKLSMDGVTDMVRLGLLAKQEIEGNPPRMAAHQLRQ